jgi:hypothetical protein
MLIFVTTALFVYYINIRDMTKIDISIFNNITYIIAYSLF